MRWIFYVVMMLGCLMGQELRQGEVFTPEEGAADLSTRAAEYPDRKAWEAKAAAIRKGILEGAKLSPLPEKTPLTPIRRGRQVMDGYSVENVAIAAWPGFWVTGNLYLPEQRESMPIMLSPHGHWRGEKLEEHGRFREDVQMRCAAMARMGCVVFAWDAVGFGESGEMGWNHDHDPEVLRIQLWSAVRALDFLWDLEGVDRRRAGITGASGGATLAMQLAAIDDRISLSVPCAMMSSYFYGGCDCESGMPIHVRPGHVTNPVEIGAVIAPKPMLVISNGSDWTAHVPEDVMPHLKRIYGFFGREEWVENAHFPEGEHDYNAAKRVPLYGFLAKHWQLDVGKADESKIRLLPAESLRVFPAGEIPPAGTIEANSEVR